MFLGHTRKEERKEDVSPQIYDNLADYPPLSNTLIDRKTQFHRPLARSLADSSGWLEPFRGVRLFPNERHHRCDLKRSILIVPIVEQSITVSEAGERCNDRFSLSFSSGASSGGCIEILD